MRAWGLELFLSEKNAFHIGLWAPSCDFSHIPIYHGFQNVGIAIQGPLDKRGDFTIYTIKMLRHIYPDVKLVLSTWIGELTDSEKGTLSELHCDVLENKGFPADDRGTGRKNSNLRNQLFSSSEGIRHLKGQGVEYVMKLRTDVRIYKSDFIQYFINLLHVYPSKSGKQKKRLLNVAFTNYSYASVPFHLSDFVMFGSIDDMEQLYSCPAISADAVRNIRESADEEIGRKQGKFWNHYNVFSIRDVSWLQATSEEWELFDQLHEEAYITHTYAVRNGMCDATLRPMEAYYRFLKNNLIVVDDHEIMAYWDKGDYSRNKPAYPRYYKLSHSEWLELLLHYDECNK